MRPIPQQAKQLYIDNKKEQPPANAGSIFVCIALNNSAVNRQRSLWSPVLNVELV